MLSIRARGKSGTASLLILSNAFLNMSSRHGWLLPPVISDLSFNMNFPVGEVHIKR